MTRKSQRELERDVDALEPEESDDAPPLVINYTTTRESPHPELTVQAWENKPESRSVAVPNIIPEEFQNNRILFVTTCKKAGKHHPADGETVGPKACELWDELDENDLRKEYEIRKANDEPIPRLLEECDLPE
jgi:hypothetical protein